MTLEDLLSADQYSLPQGGKELALLPLLVELTEYQRRSCPGYGRILDAVGHRDIAGLADVPYLPVSLFKTNLLQSVPDSEVFKIMTSSGTTGQQVSRVILDRNTADLQTRALTSIMTKVLGPQRMPMIVVDTPNVVKDRTTFSARGAGVLGMLSFGRKHFYALNDDMELDVEGLQQFLAQHAGSPVLVFGFTFMVWKYFYRQIEELHLDVDLSTATLIHSGGWKKLQDEAVGNAEFKEALRLSTKMRNVRNFYGMVEQVGGVFVEGDDGYLHAPNFAEVIVRNPETWQEAAIGEVGVVEVLSALPRSYPGHAILTEDLGIVHGVADPGAGWAGKQLEIVGRVPRAELRGCSDTHAFAGTAA